MIATMAFDTTTCIVTGISVQPKKPLGVRVEVTTLCGNQTQVRGGELKMHYDTRWPVYTCPTCYELFGSIAT